jgi:hypothetical protein
LLQSVDARFKRIKALFEQTDSSIETGRILRHSLISGNSTSGIHGHYQQQNRDTRQLTFAHLETSPFSSQNFAVHDCVQTAPHTDLFFIHVPTMKNLMPRFVCLIILLALTITCSRKPAALPTHTYKIDEEDGQWQMPAKNYANKRTLKRAWLCTKTSCGEMFPAKAQRRKAAAAFLRGFFASLRLCGRTTLPQGQPDAI